MNAADIVKHLERLEQKVRIRKANSFKLSKIERLLLKMYLPYGSSRYAYPKEHVLDAVAQAKVNIVKAVTRKLSE